MRQLHSFSTALHVGLVLLLSTAALADSDLGVRCRFNGETSPEHDSAEVWNQRWETGPGVGQVNDDCEAILRFDEETEPQWVGAELPPRLSFLRTRVEIGIGEDFVLLPGESLNFLKIDGIHLQEAPAPDHLVMVSITRADDGEPDTYQLSLAWVSDNDQGAIAEAPRVLRPGERLLLRLDWEASHDKNYDYRPDADGFVRLWVDNLPLLSADDLVIDQYTINEVRFGYKQGAAPGTYGTFFLRPLGVDTGYFDASP